MRAKEEDRQRKREREAKTKKSIYSNIRLALAAGWNALVVETQWKWNRDLCTELNINSSRIKRTEEKKRREGEGTKKRSTVHSEQIRDAARVTTTRIYGARTLNTTRTLLDCEKCGGKRAGACRSFVVGAISRRCNNLARCLSAFRDIIIIIIISLTTDPLFPVLD